VNEMLKILCIGILALLVCVSSGVANVNTPPYLTVTVGGVPVPVTWQTKDGVAYTTDVIEGTPNGAIINGLLYSGDEL